MSKVRLAINRWCEPVRAAARCGIPVAPEGIATPPLFFELPGLLVAKGGANLRNRMAQGMMAPGEFNTTPALYLWWLLLRVCVIGTPAHDAFRRSGACQDAAGSQAPTRMPAPD